MGRAAGDAQPAAGERADGAELSAVGRAGVGAAGRESYRGEIPRYGTAQPTIFWNAGAATEPP